MLDDKTLAIVGLVGVAIFAMYQGSGSAESYELAKIITSAIAGFVTGTVYVQSKKPKEEQPDAKYKTGEGTRT